MHGDRLVFFHRAGDHEVVVCLHRETGRRFWTFRYPTSYRDRFGYGNGPRASPVIARGRVYGYGAQNRLHCLDLASGKVLWRRDLASDYRLRQEFFGAAATPLAAGRLLIVIVGAPGGPCVVALDAATGAARWEAGKRWGASYASPVPAVIHGKPRLLVFAGGESDPPHGGLLSIDPATGAVDFEFPWRSTEYASVNASNPVVRGNRVFVSASYGTGGAQVAIGRNMRPQLVWKSARFGTHFSTAIVKEGHLYGFDGRHMKEAELVCHEWLSGRPVWRRKLRWTETTGRGKGRRETTMGLYRASLVQADGHFLALGELGHLAWLDLRPTGARIVVRARLFLASQSWTAPVISRGLLYVCQNTRDQLTGDGPRLVCYDLRGS